MIEYRGRFGRHCCTLAAVLALLFLLTTVAGCGGCRKDESIQPDDSKKVDKEKPKPDFELKSVAILPSTLRKEEDEDDAEPASEFDDDIELESADFDSLFTLSRSAIKPGHWQQVRHQLQANNFDFVGDLEARVVDREMNPVPLPRSPYRVVTSRPTSLPKQQRMYIDAPILVPSVPTDETRLLQVRSELQSRSRARIVDFGGRPTVRLNPHQFFMVVLSEKPERYGYLKTLTIIHPPEDDEEEWDALPGDYAIKFINGDEPLGIPSGGLAWTSTAYVIWDNLDPGLLSTDQQTAMVDWLHWGGRLVISGPRSLERLRGSFLDEFLPARPNKTLKLTEEAIEPLNSFWAVRPHDPKLDLQSYALKIGADPLEVVELQLDESASFLPSTSSLVAERRVGRGVVSVTAFSLSERRFVNWSGFDSFWNACLLRRPPREFIVRNLTDITVWEGSSIRRNPLLTSGLRFFVRDARGQGEIQLEDGNVEDGFRSDAISGIAGWDDFSPFANAARKTLQSSSGINVPDRRFVARVLSGYLVCLVPLNWMLFRLLGRVEWAWVAAPLIAILGGVGIVKMAELDIGFVRARTELAIVELQTEYARAHVARYTGLYTSLSSDYSLRFEDPSAVTAPFSTDPSRDQLRLQRQEDVHYRQDASVGLSGFPVISNSTGMVHSEQFVTMPGVLRLLGAENEWQLSNETGFGFDGSFMLYRDSDSTCQVAIVGPLTEGPVEIDFRLADAQQLIEYLNEASVTSARNSEKGETNLREAVRLAAAWQQMSVGECRFIGWNDEEIPGMTVEPRSNQSDFRTLVVSNLKYGELEQPRPDANLYEPTRLDDEGPDTDVPGFGRAK